MFEVTFAARRSRGDNLFIVVRAIALNHIRPHPPGYKRKILNDSGDAISDGCGSKSIGNMKFLSREASRVNLEMRDGGAGIEKSHRLFAGGRGGAPRTSRIVAGAFASGERKRGAGPGFKEWSSKAGDLGSL